MDLALFIYHFSIALCHLLPQFLKYFAANIQLLVKSYTMERLAEIYRTSCMKHSSGSAKDEEYDWIVSKILRCFYDKDFR